jgi:putative flavoprotein involved in K+ transport
MTAPHDETQKGPAGGEVLDVVVVGGSQAGLAMAWHLAQQGLRFVVLEAAPELGQVWRSRWDSLTLFTPAQYDALPGMAFPAPVDTYPTKDPVADYLQAYATAFQLPIRLNAKVTELRRLDDGRFEVHTADEIFQARQVVVATGPFQVPFIPPMASKLDPSVTQVHSADYRNPQALPEGPVLVVGGGNSGFQIAEELAATRQVDLSIATVYPMLPQRFLGRDLFWWLTRLGLLRVTVNSRLGRRMSRRDFVIGTNRRRLERKGVRFRPRLVDAEGRAVRFADTACWRTLGWWCGRPATDPTTPGSTSRAWSVKAASSTGAASPRCRACISWGCRGSTPAGRRCWASSPTTLPGWPTASPSATKPPCRPRSPPPRSHRASTAPRPTLSPPPAARSPDGRDMRATQEPKTIVFVLIQPSRC